jgi:hypothetical protein
MRHETKTGEQLAKSVSVKVFHPGNKKFKRVIFRADPKMGWLDEGVDQILDTIAINLEKQFPMFDYQMVQVGPNAFNFVCRGERKPEEVVAALEANA